MKMDEHGNVRTSQEWANSLTKEELQQKIDSGELVEVSEEEMTQKQKQRMQNNIQPVVVKHDHRSKLAKYRNEMKRIEKLKIEKRRKKKKASIKAKQRNRR
jgi:hypothetical protein